MTAAAVLAFSVQVAVVALSLALIMTAWRIVAGPTLPDRIVALDLLVGIVIGLIAALAVKTGYDSYLDVAIALGLVGFLATVAFARFVLRRGLAGDAEPIETPPGADEGRIEP